MGLGRLFLKNINKPTIKLIYFCNFNPHIPYELGTDQKSCYYYNPFSF